LGSVVFRNDVGVRLGWDHEYHTPYYNNRSSAGLSLFTSDYYKAINLTWATGQFEETDYHELILGKRFKFWERLPIRWDFNARFEDRPDGDRETVWLNRVVFDLFLARNMWVKTSLQVRHNELHNFSVIYGWKWRPNIQWYVVYNDVDNGVGAEEAGRSVFTKIVYSF
jgi:hypothetical protein